MAVVFPKRAKNIIGEQTVRLLSPNYYNLSISAIVRFVYFEITA